jgi:hypothetical protein
MENEQLKKLVASKCRPQNEVAAEIGISGWVLSQFLNDQYIPGKHVKKALDEWAKKQDIKEL